MECEEYSRHVGQPWSGERRSRSQVRCCRARALLRPRCAVAPVRSSRSRRMKRAHLTRVLRLTTGDRRTRLRWRRPRVRRTWSNVQARSWWSAPDRRRAWPDAGAHASAVTLAQAVLKGDRMDDVVRDAVMMGVTAIVPVVDCPHRSIGGGAVARDVAVSGGNESRSASAKQCGRAVVPRVFDRPNAVRRSSTGSVSGHLPQPAILFVEPQADTAGQIAATCLNAPRTAR